jgi:TPP-dependent pyruvate/acetoin dehydrogenase alpha subunit
MSEGTLAVTSAQPESPRLDGEQLVELFRKMLLIRRFDEQARDLYMRDMIRGSTHTYTGEEAIAVGACAALRQDDLITSTHRGHGHCLAKGGDPKAMMAELLGRATGTCKGKGGSMHIADFSLGILGANGIVGGGIGIATGAAYGLQYRDLDRVVICFFGDGAINQGVFYEAANMAALWSLPVVYLCEENRYAEFSPSAPMMSVDDLVVRASAFDMPGESVDGNDVLAVYETTGQAVARARRGDGPTLIIARTYRLEGHTIGDPLTYRPEGEAETWWEREPIGRFRQVLEGEGILTEEEADSVEAAARAEIEAAVEFALKSPPPSVDELLRDVTVEGAPCAS